MYICTHTLLVHPLMHNEIKCIGGFRERGKRMRPLRIIGLPIIIKAVTFSSCCILIISIYLIRTGSSRLHIIWHCYQSLFCFLIVCIILFHIKTQLPTDCIFPFKFYYKNNFKPVSIPETHHIETI